MASGFFALIAVSWALKSWSPAEYACSVTMLPPAPVNASVKNWDRPTE